jgi:hypothetical protein
MGLLAFAALMTVVLAIAISVGCPGGGCPDDPPLPSDGGSFADLQPAPTPAHPAKKHRTTPREHAPAPRPKPAAPAPKPDRRPAPTSPSEQPHPSAPAPQPSARAPQPSAPEPQPSAPAPRPSEPEPQPSAPAPEPSAPEPLDVAGAAKYVRAFYADLAERNFRAAWPRLASDQRVRHGSLTAWERGFATTVSQSISDVFAAQVGPATANVTLTLTAVDRTECNRDVTRRFAVVWQLEQRGGEWRAAHAEAEVLAPGVPCSARLAVY